MKFNEPECRRAPFKFQHAESGETKASSSAPDLDRKMLHKTQKP